MTFKEFLTNEENFGGSGSGDKGMMGFGKASSVKKPSDGQPFKNLSSVAGQEPRSGGGAGGAAGGATGAPMFMKKKMLKMMKKD